MDKKKIGGFKGLFLAMSVVVGTVIGSGVFFKNESMIAWAHGNAWIVAGAWFIGALVALLSAVSFSQIARKIKKSNSGIGQMSEEMIGKNVGWHTKINWVYFYFPWNITLIALYSANYIIKISTGVPASGSTYGTLWVMGLALAIIVFLFSFHVLWKDAGYLVQMGATIVKLIPLIILAVGSIILFFEMPANNWWTQHGADKYNPTIANDTNGMKSIFVLIFIIPGTLFAFDSFINATNVSEIVSKKHVTYAIVGGMMFVIIVELLCSLAVLTTGTLSPDEALIKLFGGNPVHPSGFFLNMKKIIEVFIVISALGGLNGFMLVWTNAIKTTLKKKTKKNEFIVGITAFTTTGLPFIIITLLIYFTNYQAGISNSNHGGNHIGISFVDALSNPLIIIAYTVYALTLFFAVYRNHKVKNKADKFAWWFNITAIIAGSIIFMVLGYIFCYSIIYKALSGNGTFGGLKGWLFLLVIIWYVILYAMLPMVIRKLKPNFLNEPGKFFEDTK